MLPPATPRLRRVATLLRACALGLGLSALVSSAHADGPVISGPLKKMLGGLPIGQSKDQLQAMMGALKQTSCGGGLTGCYAVQSGKLQLYLFSSKQAQQTVLLVVDDKVTMPSVLKKELQNLFGGTSLQAPIFSLSTTDYTLDVAKMPPALQKVMRERYFNINSMDFAAGVQLAARADLAGVMKKLIGDMGVDVSKVMMRAALVMPIPADLMSGAGTGVGVASDVADGETMKNAGLDALKPEAFVEFQFPPGAPVGLTLPKATLTDATFFINNALTFGYKGNTQFEGMTKKILMQFQTPLTPAGAMDLLDFSFRMATPPTLTLEDYARVMIGMATPDPRLAKYGGGFIKNIDVIKKPLLMATKPLAVFQVRNPVPPNEYQFNNPAKPFPQDENFNVVLAGPMADGGPLLKAAGNAYILGQKMGTIDVLADVKGFDGLAIADLTLKIGPLGRVTLAKVLAQAEVNGKDQRIRLKGNVGGQVVEVILGDQLAINVPANCVNPFEIKASVTFHSGTNIADVFEGQGGVNVDPSKIYGCVGKELEAAYRKIAGEYKNLSGYTAKEANEALKQMSGTAEYVAAQTQKQAEIAAAETKKQAEAAAAEAARQAEAARKEYERTKNAARDAASKATNGAAKAFADAGNAFKRLGKKKKHKKGPDPKFAGSVFDWDYYYDTRQDLVRAKYDLATHWKDHGLYEGARGSREFDTRFYWSRYTDVQARCRQTDYPCVLQHWLDYGLDEGRQGSADFSIYSLMRRHQDLQNAFWWYDDLMEWWLDDANEQTRDASPLWVTSGAIPGPKRAGGTGGSPWTDRPFCQDQAMDGFRVRSGKRIGWVQFRYAGRWADSRGDQGDRSSLYEVTLPAGEYFTRVDLRAGAAIDALKFFTNRGRSFGPYGGGGGGADSYTATPGEKLGCVMGRQGDRLDSLTFTSTGPR